MKSIFAILPANFFSPLASPNREAYAACLLIFYRLFQDSPGGVERSALVGRLTEYFASAGQLYDEGAESEKAVGDLNNSADDGEAIEIDADQARLSATRALRILIAAGWMGEDERSDYTRMVTIAAAAKPFLDALAQTEEGGPLEYESHVVAIYSSLCGDAVKDHGHYAVLNAHYHLTLLIDSLKVLSQNIRVHYERLLEDTAGAEIPEILRLHYDRYLEDVVDRAYARLKTSDNLSRYRPKIVKAANSLLTDKKWLEKTAASLALVRRESTDDARRRLQSLLEDIRDQLRALDPTLDEIDRRNMLYVRSSLERIRSRLRSDGTMAGRLIAIVRAVAADGGQAARLKHRLHRVRWLGKDSRYVRWFRENAAPTLDARPAADRAALERTEAELRLRIAKQLTPERIAAWLDEHIPLGDRGRAQDLVSDAESFVRILHAAAYAEGRATVFPYSVDWKTEETVAAGWLFRDHYYRRKK